VQPTCTVDEVWENGWLGLGRSSLYAAVRDGSVPSLRIGGRIVIPTSELRRLLGLTAEVAQ
jgi:predicted DNA-binding transcriptional regulator AlpA